ncbi:MAG: glycosyltransferase [Flavobacteriales bacterium]
MEDKPRILVAPLDWGLGHATRCIPLIQELRDSGAEVLIGTSEHSMALLKQEFPDLTFLEMPGYKVSYPRDGNMAFHMLKLAPRIRRAVKKEHKALDRYIESHHIDAVISDNRLGLFNKRVPTVLITHQLFIQTPRFRWAAERLNRHYISRFDQCWVPDVADVHENLSGALSHGTELPKGLAFIGPLSRFSLNGGQGYSGNEQNDRTRVLGLISGPEPQRGMLAETLNEELKDLDLDATLVTGMPQKGKGKKESPRIRKFHHLPTNELQRELMRADLIVSRSGYSTIMDLAAVGRKAVLIPTPGQSEQEYLALYHDKKRHFLQMQQDRFELKDAMKDMEAYHGVHLPPRPEELRERLKDLIEEAS